MKFIEITIHTSTIGSELISDILWNYTDHGVAISDVNDIIELSRSKRNVWDYIDEELIDKKSDVLVKGYVEKDRFDEVFPQIRKDILVLAENLDKSVLGSLEIIKRDVDGDEWLESWKEHFKPIKIGNVVICPEWVEYTAKEGETVTKIDSNIAFGTGEHETTSMCIELLQDYIKPDLTVIDVGCGSGILGITASKLGAKNVIMTDIDECAVDASHHNAKLNGITADIRLKNLLDDNEIIGDIILANIMAEVLVYFSTQISKNLKENGTIILSGILLEKEEMVLTAYEKAGFSLQKTIKKGEWVALALKKV